MAAKGKKNNNRTAWLIGWTVLSVVVFFIVFLIAPAPDSFIPENGLSGLRGGGSLAAKQICDTGSGGRPINCQPAPDITGSEFTPNQSSFVAQATSLPSIINGVIASFVFWLLGLPVAFLLKNKRQSNAQA